MRLPKSDHTGRPWRIHEIAGDFKLEDVWALPTPGGPGELPRLTATISAMEFPEGAPPLVRLVWNARWKLGALFGWDRDKHGTGGRVATLRDRMPDDLRRAPTDPRLDGDAFTSLYQLEDEWAAELANRTVHTVMHLSWVPDGSGGYRGQMAVLVKPNGWFGTAYMAAILPFRYLLVYPALLRTIERGWKASANA
ncbi:DUF2867 domain-containing protein [Spirillospora sp. CA-294931]|uniref:DUF2867 domain-containing protein n=1 Tax=Spirillospora sp. CA-294931 TaxID=3240042 RepID=UPI003D8D8293